MLVIGMFSGLAVVSQAHKDQALIETGVRADGVVSDVRIDIRRDTNNNSNSRTSKNKSSKITYVSFTAENKQEYTTKFSEKYKGGKTGISVSAKEDMGKKMTVFYDKSNPNQAVVEGKEASATTGYMIGGGFLFFGLFVIIACTIQLKKKKEKEDDKL